MYSATYPCVNSKDSTLVCMTLNNTQQSSKITIIKGEVCCIDLFVDISDISSQTLIVFKELIDV